jgi:hypothetical protein
VFDENIKNHAVSLALLLIYIDFDRKVFKSIKSNSALKDLKGHARGHVKANIFNQSHPPRQN